ncbi:hypothetical protein HYH03_000885 [Edaphochlamys debaryana]|uniref:Uncharacterized protein n=1 Tax=Edaphochlamys debaryana TaxID=47281 RepID=A0A835YHI3_9CHLO|nr:hypothetical protein HYH03_000885 [Edaphochlamys debaryana]|eukprot:KAG2501066.1 hypothetical protein HYH03_000885 [Edaphochlamys debaryana]
MNAPCLHFPCGPAHAQAVCTGFGSLRVDLSQCKNGTLSWICCAGGACSNADCPKGDAGSSSGVDADGNPVINLRCDESSSIDITLKDPTDSTLTLQIHDGLNIGEQDCSGGKPPATQPPAAASPLTPAQPPATQPSATASPFSTAQSPSAQPPAPSSAVPSAQPPTSQPSAPSSSVPSAQPAATQPPAPASPISTAQPPAAQPQPASAVSPSTPSQPRAPHGNGNSKNWGTVFKIPPPPGGGVTYMTQAGYVIMCAGCGQNMQEKGYVAAELTISVWLKDIATKNGGTKTYKYQVSFDVELKAAAFSASDINAFLGSNMPRNAPGSWKPKPTLLPPGPVFTGPMSFTVTKLYKHTDTAPPESLFMTLHFVSTKCPLPQ